MSDETAVPRPSQLIGNIGEPIGLNELNVHGVSASAARGGEQVKVWTRLAITSDGRNFHRIATNLNAVIEHCVR